MRPIISSVKHYIHKSLSTVTAGTTDNIILAKADGGSNDFTIKEGAIVKAIFVEMWVRAGDTAPGSVLMSLMKLPGVGNLPTFAKLVDLNNYDNKKNILYHTQGLTNDQDADAIPFIRQWFKIPKGKQRFGQDDELVLSISAQALDSIVCGFATYKEYN